MYLLDWISSCVHVHLDLTWKSSLFNLKMIKYEGRASKGPIINDDYFFFQEQIFLITIH